MIMCVLLCYPVSIRIYYQQGVLFLVEGYFTQVLKQGEHFPPQAAELTGVFFHRRFQGCSPECFSSEGFFAWIQLACIMYLLQTFRRSDLGIYREFDHQKQKEVRNFR